ncbi:MAG: exo-alpha-sialidase [Candidatus Eremiobacteraeota bacterium]|nr:exo-alpha-sialidase [Candidatus Eremiobacteraeota bacterium]
MSRRTTITLAALSSGVALLAILAGTRAQGAPFADLPPFGPERGAALQIEHPFQSSEAMEAQPHEGRDGFDRERLWSGYDDWEPATAADPSSPYVYELTTRLSGPRCERCAKVSMIFRRSHDHGATWEPDQFLIASRINQWDPQIKVARNGTVYVAFLLLFRPGVTFMRSTDRGTTWSRPISFSGRGHTPAWSDRPALAVSPSGRDVYIGFNHSDSWIVASHDGGKTFAPPIQTSHDHRYYFHSAGTVAPDGSVSFVAEDYSQNYHGPVHIDVIHSRDGGRSWSTVRIDTGQATPRCGGVPGCYYGFLGPVGGLAADAAGNLLVAYNINHDPFRPQRLFARTSRDGLHWSAAAEISGTNPGVDNAFPAVAAGVVPGDFRVVWMNTRLGMWDTWERRLVDGSWGRAIRLSNRRHGAPYKHPHGFGFPYGDYLGVTVDADGKTFAIFGAGPNYNGPGGTWYTREAPDGAS